MLMNILNKYDAMYAYIQYNLCAPILLSNNNFLETLKSWIVCINVLQM